MSRKKKLNFIIPLVVYPFDVMVSFGETENEIIRILESLELSESDITLALFHSDTINGRAVMFESNQTLIRLRNFPKSPEEYGVLHHGIFHAVTFIMSKIGMELIILKSDEAYAYLIQYLTREIYERINYVRITSR